MPASSPIQSLQQQRLLLRLEYQTEREAYGRQSQAMGIDRLVKRGDAWFPLRTGKSYYNSLNQFVLEVYRTGDEEIDHNFEFGKPVVFFRRNNDAISEFRHTATVAYVDGNRMVVALNEALASDLQCSEEALGLRLSFDETSYHLMFDALDRAINAKGNRLAYLRDLFHSKQPAQRYSFASTRFPWLNATQEQAVNEVLRAKDVAVVHGPPGTGKTTTLVEAINETLMRESQVLVCAQSNMAVDWISEQLVDRGVSVLRIGNPSRVNDKMLSFTYERRFADHPDYPQLWAMRKAMRELRKARKGRDNNFHQKMDRLKSRVTELEIRIHGELMSEARVIAATLTGAGNRLLDGQKFGTLFIDEAAQALEAACWIAIRRVSRVVLAGDHCQLPPTVKSIAALKAGLGKTLMERIVENKPECVTLLQTQYRMKDEIMRFSSEWFYEGKVKTAPQVQNRGILDWEVPIEWIQSPHPSPEKNGSDDSQAPDSPNATVASDKHVTPLSHREGAEGEAEEFVGENYGRINRAEATLTLTTLREYLTKIGKQRILDERIDVGIISPYRAQVQHLKHLLKKHEFFKPYRHLITVNTVDGFQGQERDIIIVSMVRSNDAGQIGFLRDLRRMNVAITRARMKLIIIGDARTLTRHSFYKKLYDYVQALQNQ